MVKIKSLSRRILCFCSLSSIVLQCCWIHLPDMIRATDRLDEIKSSQEVEANIRRIQNISSESIAKNKKDTESLRDIHIYAPTYHFLPTYPTLNWMNDPNGMFYDASTSTYHVFYQYATPRVWGHAYSKDLLHWEETNIALGNDNDYVKGGVFSGSATFVQEVFLVQKNTFKKKRGNAEPITQYTPVLSFSSANNEIIGLAYPKYRGPDLYEKDPFLREWEYLSSNPIICSDDYHTSNTSTESPISSCSSLTFNGRDPSTAWLSLPVYENEKESTQLEDNLLWHMSYAVEIPWKNAGGAMIYNSKFEPTSIKSKDKNTPQPNSFANLDNGYFTKWKRSNLLYYSNSTDMWECPDFFITSKPYQDPKLLSFKADAYLKFSLMQTRNDYYLLGTYHDTDDIFTDNLNMSDQSSLSFLPKKAAFPYDVSLKALIDHGSSFYASKSFESPGIGSIQDMNRHILIGWLQEERSLNDSDPSKPYGWAGTFGIPREIKSMGSLSTIEHLDHIKTPPISEFKNLREQKFLSLSDIELKPGENMTLNTMFKRANRYPTDNLVGRSLEIIVELEISEDMRRGDIDYNCGLAVLATSNDNKDMEEVTYVGVKKYHLQKGKEIQNIKFFGNEILLLNSTKSEKECAKQCDFINQNNNKGANWSSCNAWTYSTIKDAEGKVSKKCVLFDVLFQEIELPRVEHNLNGRFVEKYVSGYSSEYIHSIPVNPLYGYLPSPEKRNDSGAHFYLGAYTDCTKSNLDREVQYRTISSAQVIYDQENRDLNFSQSNPSNVNNRFDSYNQNLVKLHIFIDKSIVEVFVNDGNPTITRRVYPVQYDKAVNLRLHSFLNYSPKLKPSSCIFKSIDVWGMENVK